MKQTKKDKRPEQVKQRKKPPLMLRLGVAVLSPLLFLLIVELLLWVCGYGTARTFFVDWANPNRHVYLANPHYCEHFVSRALSRAPEPSVLYPKDTSTIRIFVLGGSAANGDPDPAYGFCRQLEILLNEHAEHQAFEVVNVAVTAMNSVVARCIARDCAAHQPDLFIVYMGNNEIVGPFGPPTLPEALYRHRWFINASITVQKDIRLGQLVRNMVQTLRSAGHAPRRWAGMESFLQSRMAIDDPKLADCYRHFQANVRDIVHIAEQAGAPTLLCTVPTNLAACAPFASGHRPTLTDSQIAQFDQYFATGQHLRQSGDYTSALDQYADANALDDTYADLAYGRGQCLLALNRLTEAKAALVRARDLDTLRFRADSRINGIIRNQARELAAHGAALLDLEACLEQDNQGHPLDNTLLVDHVHLNPRGNFLMALAAMQTVRTVLPQAHLREISQTTDALYTLCTRRLLYDTREQYRLALLMYTRKTRPPFTGQLGHEEELAALNMDLAGLAAEMKQTRDPESSYVRARQVDADDAFLVRRYGAFLGRHQRMGEAVQLYQSFLDRHVYAPQIRMDLAQTYAGAGARDKALALLTDKQTPFPLPTREALQWLGSVYVQQSRYQEAARTFKELYRLDSRNVTSLVSLASALSHLGDAAGARQYLDLALNIDPNAFPAVINMGNYYVKQGNVPEAHTWFERAVGMDPYNYIAQFNLGTQKLKLGKVRDGLKHITQAVILQPDFVQGYESLASVYRQFDKPDVAQKYETLKTLYTP